MNNQMFVAGGCLVVDQEGPKDGGWHFKNQLLWYIDLKNGVMAVLSPGSPIFENREKKTKTRRSEASETWRAQ